jgi:hypothetical protein
MTSLWTSTVASLDDALDRLNENLARLEAAKHADMTAMLNHIQMAAESARMLRELVSSQLPDAAWQNRAELNALIAQEMQRGSEIMPGGIFPAELVGEPVPARRI